MAEVSGGKSVFFFPLTASEKRTSSPSSVALRFVSFYSKREVRLWCPGAVGSVFLFSFFVQV